MLLFLRKDGVVYYLLPNTKLTVGRMNCNINLSKDQSISRIHANISNDNGKIYLTDVGSSNGTYVYRNNVNNKLLANTKFELALGDQVKFGLQKNIWSFTGTQFETSYTKLSSDEKKALGSYASQIGINISSEWTNTCTHLTASQVFLTVKILCALITGSKIVLIDYWKDCLKSIEKNEPLPNCQKYYPPFDKNLTSEDSLLFDYKPSRKTLFKGKTFVFQSEKEYKQKGKMIEIAGGQVKMLNTVDKKRLTIPDVIVLKSSLNNEKNDEIQQILSNHGLRIVPDHEVVVAILSCDISKNCNPSYHFKENCSEDHREVLGAKFITDTQSSSMKYLSNQQTVLSLDLCKDKNSQNNQLVCDSNPNVHTTGNNMYLESQDNNVNKWISEKSKVSNIHSDVIKHQLSEDKYLRSEFCNKRRMSDELISEKSKKQCLEQQSQFYFQASKDVSVDNMFSSFEESSKDMNENENLHKKNTKKRSGESHELLSLEPKRLADESRFPLINMSQNQIHHDSVELPGWFSKSMCNLHIKNQLSTSKCVSNESLIFFNALKDGIIIKPSKLISKNTELKMSDKRTEIESIKNFKKFKKVHPKRYASEIIVVGQKQVLGNNGVYNLNN